MHTLKWIPGKDIHKISSYIQYNNTLYNISKHSNEEVFYIGSLKYYFYIYIKHDNVINS